MMRQTDSARPGHPSLRDTLAIAAIYFAAAKLGLTMAFTAAQVSPVWPPTGIALTAMLMRGRRVWPGIALGAFLANVTAREPVLTAAGIAAGNTLEALVGAWLLRRASVYTALRRVQGGLPLIRFPALLRTPGDATG